MIKISIKKIFKPFLITFFIVLLCITGASLYFYERSSNFANTLTYNLSAKQTELTNLQSEFDAFKTLDQVKINTDLKKEMEMLSLSYKKTVTLYESILDLKLTGSKQTLEKDLASIINLLSQQKNTDALTAISTLQTKIASEEAKMVIKNVAAVDTNVNVSNTPPGNGYSRQKVKIETGEYIVSMVAADLSSTKVLVDTASDSTCTNDCPVLPLATYASKNNAFAAVNGSYFCPASYPTCAGKTNSFDLLLMNKNKTYFNSDNNIYSSNPGVIFGGSYIRFVSQVSQWGRDTGIDSMLSNYPLLLSGGNVTFSTDSDPKKTSRGNRSFVANKGNIVYIGVVHGVSVGESALVMRALGFENAMNLDSGGSTALWSGGYKVGPGRDIPNAIVFVKK